MKFSCLMRESDLELVLPRVSLPYDPIQRSFRQGFLLRDRIIGQKEKPGSYFGIGEGKIGKVKRICRKVTSQRNQTGGRKRCERLSFRCSPHAENAKVSKSTALALSQAFRELDACVPLTSRFPAMLVVKKCEV